MLRIFKHWRMVVRLTGMLAIGLALLALLSDLHIVGGGLDYRPTALGQAWHNWHAPSLNLVQAIVERYILPQLWRYALLPLLLSPVWIVAAIMGSLCIGASYVRIWAHSAASPSR
jgi:hypothetical protein